MRLYYNFDPTFCGFYLIAASQKQASRMLGINSYEFRKSKKGNEREFRQKLADKFEKADNNMRIQLTRLRISESFTTCTEIEE